MRTLTWLAPGCILALALPASAYELHSDGTTTLDLGIEIGAGAFHSGADYSGQNRGNVDWTEGYTKLSFTGTTKLSATATLRGGISMVGSRVDGDGDALGYTTGGEKDFELNDAYAGLRFDGIYGGKGYLDISAGAQSILIGDGFLIGPDSTDGGNGFGGVYRRGGTYWLAPLNAYSNTAIIDTQLPGGLTGKAFWLDSDNPAQGRPDLAGLDLSYKIGGIGTLGATYVRVTDVDADFLDGAFAMRKDLQTASLRFQGNAGVKNLFLATEFARQWASDRDGLPDVKAWAGQAEIGWTFASLPWSPSLGYRYSYFSGDDPRTADYEGFDPLFYTSSRGYGTWIQGEVAGNYAGPWNSNAGVHMVRLTVSPTDRLSLGALWFDFNCAECDSAVNNYGHAREFDLTAEWTVTDNVYISAIYGHHMPSASYERATGIGKDNNYAAIYTIMTF